MAEGGFLKPSTSHTGFMKKATDKGQFANPPEYPETAGFSGSGKIGGRNVLMKLESTPSAKKGKV